MSFHDPHLLARAGGRLYAVPGTRILRIARYEEGGEARIDLSRVLGEEGAAVSAETSVVVVEAGPEASIGLVVDEAVGIVTFGADELLPPPDFGPGVAAPYIAALGKHEDAFAIVLDLDRLLDGREGDA